VNATATDLFLSLRPEKVLAAVEAAGLETRPVCYPLNSFENRVYEVELVDRSRVIAKFYRPGRWNREQILEEHQFLLDVDRDEIPVGTVSAFPDGSTVRQIENIYYSLFDRRGGRAPDELNDKAVLRLGRLVGRLHATGASREAQHRLGLTADHYIRRNLDWLADRSTLPDAYQERYFKAASHLADIADQRMEGVATHRIHGDLHLGNVLDRDGLLTLLDFDDMLVGPAVQDLWLALPGRDQYTRRQRDLFIEGYENFRFFDRSTLNLIEPLRAMRLVRYATWLARRWHDPAFPAAWPHFGTDEYWQNETEALEEILHFVKTDRSVEGAGASYVAETAAEEEPELTNKDYFWDWDGD
jgi:Ser/Thr protein kinase RdoA (MazF antagonist)